MRTTRRTVKYHHYVSILDFFSAQEGRAIPAHPALRDNGTPIEIINLGSGTRRKGPFSQSEAMRHLNAYGGKNDAIDHVMNCIRLYCDAASNAEWHLEKKGEKLRRPEQPSDEGQIGPIALYNLLDQPNPYMDYEELVELLVIDLLLVGNAYWYKWRSNEKGQPLALYRLAPPFVKVIPGDMGVIGYEYRVPDAGQREPLKIDPKDCIHFKLPNPHSPYYGLGVVQGGARPMDLDLALTDHQANYFEKGTNISMVVQSERRIPKDVFKKLSAQLRGRYAGSKNAGELMVLEAGLTASSIAPNAAEAQFEVMSKLSRERVMAMFRVHPKLLGIVAADGTDKATDAQRVFDHNTLQPFFNKLSKRVSRALAQAYDVDFKIDHRYRMPAEDQVKLAGDFATIPGVTVKEVREFLDLPPTGDPEIDDLVLNLPGDDGLPGDTRNGFPDRNLPGEPGRPPRGENTAAFGTVGGGSRPDLVKGSRARRPSEKKSLDQIIREIAALPTVEEKAAVNFEDPEKLVIEPPQDPFGARRDAEIDAISNQLTKDLRDAGHLLERELLDIVEGKAFNSKTLRSRMRQSQAWENFRDRVSTAIESAVKAGLSRAAVMWGGAGRQPDDSLDYDALAREITWRSGGVNGIIRTQRNRVSKHVDDALAAGAGEREAEEAVREAMNVWRETQAETIALTEAVHAFNEGTLTVAELTGASHVYVQDGDEDDQPCIDANGSVWTIEKARENRLEHPRCRRSFLPLNEVPSTA
jgi:HK97 family phage portal protein